MTALHTLTPHLAVYPGPLNTGVLYDGDRVLLIDCGDGRVREALAGARVEALLFTHHHRDQACGAGRFPDARVHVPAGERRWFDDVASFWNDPIYRWHLVAYHPHHLMLAEPVAVDRALRDGDVLTWGPATITALATPGHTDGSLTCLVEVDGRRIAFTGDVIAGPGQVWELFSLQKNGPFGDYHGFLGARDELADSLRKVKAAAPDIVVPAHGELMPDPAAAIDALLARLASCYHDYAMVNALRWYYPDWFVEYDGDPAMLPVQPTEPPPAWLRHTETSWVLQSESGAVLVMDCWNDTVATLQAWQAAGEIGPVEGLWITHYHYDHIDGVPAFQQTFDCPLIADARLAEVLEHPRAWRLPCITPAVCRVDRATAHGERWQWREFTLTAYHLPGQTLYHGGLLVEGRGMRLFFVGDSFSPTGLDDYCAPNRNFLGAGVGYQRCLTLVEELQPDWMFNAHIDVGFRFPPETIRVLRVNLARREAGYGALLPWPHANFGMDEFWARCHPYEQTAVPGAAVTLALEVTNHAPDAQEVACRFVLPQNWQIETTELTARVAAGATVQLTTEIRLPPGVAPGRYVIPVDVRLGDRELPQWTEAIIEAAPA